jgi:DinB superfamily
MQSGVALPLSFKRAAAAASEPLDAADREFLLGWLRRTGESYAKAPAGLTPAQWRFNPAPDRWSIAECAEHVVIAEGDLFRVATQQILRIPLPEGQQRLGRSDDDRLLQRMTDRSRKVTAAESQRPKGAYATPADAARAFAAARAATIEWVSATQTDLRGHGVKAQGGFTDAYQFLLTIAAHTARHLAQIDEVKADGNFP